MNLWLFIIVGFAVFRLWRLIAVDSLFARLRSGLPSRQLAFLQCPWCSGFWLAVVAYFVVDEWGSNRWVMAAIHIFAVSGLVGLLAHATGDDR
jgi:hypothetical protein